MVDTGKTDELPDRVYNNYIGATFFITGGTGFLGKVIIEKLLRMFDVKKIYILIRTKKDKSADVRLRDIFANPLFDSVRQLKGDQIFDKCTVVSGDVTKDNLDLSEEDREILKREIEYVIHAAATIRFDEPLRRALLMNTKGVLSMIQLAKEMKDLKLFCHISTTFCHPDQKVLKEEFYRSKHDARMLINLAEWFDDDAMGTMSKFLMKDVPNTYTFTKALGEDLVADATHNIPVIIIRPSIVVPIWKEPIPGWLDNINGPMGMMLAAGKGIVRSMYGNRDAVADCISVDIAADGILVILSYAAHNGIPRNIYNLCAGTEFQMTWGEIVDIGEKIVREKVPFDLILWPPGGAIRKSRIIHYFMFVLCQLIPALLVDLIVPCFGYKPFLWKAQKRIMYGQSVLTYYTSHEWVFDNRNCLNARQWMNEKEMAKYVVTVEGLDIEEYFTNATMCTRRYILHEPDENLPKAKCMMKIMIRVDKVCNILLKLLLTYLFYKWIVLRMI